MSKVCITNPELIPKMLEVLDLLLKKPELSFKTVHHVYPVDNSLYVKNTSPSQRFIHLMNNSLFNHRYKEAAKMLWILCQDSALFNVLLYKGIMVALENLIPVGYEVETMKDFHREVKYLKFISELEIDLECLIYALKNDIPENVLSVSSVEKMFSIQPSYIAQLLSAYHALRDYIKWVNIFADDPSSKCESNKFESSLNSESMEFGQSLREESMEFQSSFEDKTIVVRVIDCFKKLIEHPGIWDVFIVKLIELLEYHEKYEEIEEVLKKYVEVNPHHVNAYIYICVHLHKHKSDPNVFIQYAKVLVDLCPSDTRVLLLVQKWDELGKYLKKRLKILFIFLDYPTNGKNVLAWEMLSSHLMQAISSKKPSAMKAVKSSWSLRCSTWNYMYFNSTDIHPENVVLVSNKMKALFLLDSGHEYIKDAEETYQSISSQELTVDENIPVIPEDISSLYNLDIL